ncbi:heat-inducible transcriptional repressor HrcA [Magnetospira sp. QH-2]|uniref:heat-inducible transcriptional repressor HrcA n=1 Tax=Magnetospira sp. (strain QH-2) TaxID=1288970 RepID=UPI0005FA89B4|nr:heat-inducible transcriptional repressor HrcA [Magnetospira sp. QH-2]
MITDLNDRSREIFRQIVDSYLETGEPVGSRTLARLIDGQLSPATIRNVMADLEDMGLLMAPHTSAGRLPTEAGLRLFVDGLLEIGDLGEAERSDLEQRVAGSGKSMEGLLEEASTTLSGLTHCAGLVMAPKTESPLKHIEFVALSPGRVLVVMVAENGLVENRVIEVPLDLPPSALVEAGNFLSARLLGRTIGDAQSEILTDLECQRGELDRLTSKVVGAGLAVWGGEEQARSLIVRGRANLLEDVEAVADLERIRSLFTALEQKETLLRLLEQADQAEGVQIFIGAENQLFGAAGCSMIVAPYRNGAESIVGALGVIGPTRMNYARIIPMVDYTARIIGRLIG